MSLPPLAANAVAKLLTDNVKRPDGGDATAFNDQRDALIMMREKVMELETRLAVAEGQLDLVPFPFRGSSTPPGA